MTLLFITLYHLLQVLKDLILYVKDKKYFQIRRLHIIDKFKSDTKSLMISNL